MLTADQNWACRASWDNDEWWNTILNSNANDVRNGRRTLGDVHDAYCENFPLCKLAASFVNACYPWANVSPYDIPEAVYDYIDVRLLESA